ncbi:MAG: hypothetical protein J6X62_07275 [Bacteroidales bacterium]|nr:hypothetical protein [Bacteroidales bacterium]
MTDTSRARTSGTLYLSGTPDPRLRCACQGLLRASLSEAFEERSETASKHTE